MNNGRRESVVTALNRASYTIRTCACWPCGSLLGSWTTTVWPVARACAATPSTVTLVNLAAPVRSVTRLNVSADSGPPAVFVTVAVLVTDMVDLDQCTKARATYVARSDRSFGAAATGL